MLSGISSGTNTRHRYKVRSIISWTDTSVGFLHFQMFIILFSDVFALVTSNEIRKLRQDQPENLATLIYKATERLVKAVDNSCRTSTEQQAVLNCVRLLTRVIPYIFEDSEWKDFFFEALPSSSEKEESAPLAHSLVNAICVSSNSWLKNIEKIKLKILVGSSLLSRFYRHSSWCTKVWTR